MISLSTAKMLLFIALLIGPKCGNSDHSIEIVNKNSYCVWAQDSTGWSLTQLGRNNQHWPEGGTSSNFVPQHLRDTDSALASEVTHHNWNASANCTLNMPNGDIIEKQGSKIFYTTNAGAPNQEIYTILTIKDGKTL
jgi:hypothetical protein